MNPDTVTILESLSDSAKQAFALLVIKVHAEGVADLWCGIISITVFGLLAWIFGVMANNSRDRDDDLTSKGCLLAGASVVFVAMALALTSTLYDAYFELKYPEAVAIERMTSGHR